MNLIKELSVGYFQERFGGCMFFDPDKKASYIDTSRSWHKNEVGIITVSGTASKPVTEEAVLPYDFFTGLEVFGVPNLGWRSAAQGRYMVYMSRNNRAYHRGVSREVLQRWLSPATQFLIDTDNISEDYYTRVATTTSMVMQPEYVPFTEGVSMLKRGELFSFCTSANLAVIPDVGDDLAIYFNSNRVGSVKSNGQIDCTIPVINQIIKDNT